MRGTLRSDISCVRSVAGQSTCQTRRVIECRARRGTLSPVEQRSQASPLPPQVGRSLLNKLPTARQAKIAQVQPSRPPVQTPSFMVDPEILRRIEPTGVLQRIRNAQNAVLNNLLNDQRCWQFAAPRAQPGSGKSRRVLGDCG